MTTRNSSRPGFALGELLTLIALIALLAALVLVIGGNSRRTARLDDDLAKLRFIGSATASYAADNADAAWAFSWQSGVDYGTKHGDLNMAFTDLDAAANQAVYIMRRRTGRDDIPRISSWIPHAAYSHLVLVDYLDQALPDHTFVSSGDNLRRQWADDPACFDQGCFGPTQPPPSGANRRWPYSASLMLPAAFWDRSTAPNRISHGGTHNTYTTPSGAELGGVLLSGVAFPPQKVLLHDQFAWHFGQRIAYSTHTEARLPMLFVDGSAHVKAAAESNSGWHPNNPTSPSPHTFTYSPPAWEPATFANQPMIGRFRWTRGGILGRDFGGAEIDTSP